MAALAGLLALVAGIVDVVVQVDRARTSLTSAEQSLKAFKAGIGQQGGPSTRALYRSIDQDTATASSASNDPVWGVAEHVPIVGPNLRAVRQVTGVVRGLVVHGVGPLADAADGLSLAALKPSGGRIDIALISKLERPVADLDDALTTAAAQTSQVDTAGTIGDIRAAVSKLKQTIGEAQPVTAELRSVLPVLYPALGGNGTRHYLLMFQNNAEERASGGNPAALAMLTVDDGHVSLGRQANSRDFGPYANPLITFPGDWHRLYGDHVVVYEPNITYMPDFTQVAQVARTLWTNRFGGTVDGVISFDPVALSYLLKATGPITLTTGEHLDSTNAVQYLLSDVYAKYTDPAVQDAIFASTAKEVFSALTSGVGDPRGYVAALTPMLAEQRLKIWSVRDDEEAILAKAGVATMLPVDNTEKTVIGVYNDDTATSKMSYYMNATIGVHANMCTADPTWAVSTTITNTVQPSQAASLPAYVRASAPGIAAGWDRQWVYIYGPVGATLTGATIDGKPVVWGSDQSAALNTVPNATGVEDRRPSVNGELDGRPVAVIDVKFAPGQSITVAATFHGATLPSTTLGVSHTPKVRAVPVTITSAKC